jgi:hypothetical protein
MMRRTIGFFITLALTFLAAAPLTDAQLPGKKIPRIGYLLDGSPGDSVRGYPKIKSNKSVS